MRELGASAAAEHEAVGRLAVRLGVRQLVVVGDEARAVHQGALLEGAQEEEAVLVADTDEAVRWLGAHAGPDDVVLVKASRGARLDVVAEALLRPTGAGDPPRGDQPEGDQPGAAR
jgi:UDP-N-acetylmuramoyl-tripeptide--D-alanyl-D-alanine ligase